MQVVKRIFFLWKKKRIANGSDDDAQDIAHNHTIKKKFVPMTKKKLLKFKAKLYLFFQ